MPKLVEVRFDWMSVKLTWRRREHWFVKAEIVDKKIHYHGRLENEVFSGIDTFDQCQDFVSYIDKFKQYPE
jgi:hypothetical protein